MGVATKHNKGNKFNFTFPEETTYYNLEQLMKDFGEDKKYIVRALSINTKGQYGDQGVIWLDGDIAVNLPKHMVEDIRAIMSDEEDIQQINDGRCAFKVRPYNKENAQTKKVQTYYGIEWIDL